MAQELRHRLTRQWHSAERGYAVPALAILAVVLIGYGRSLTYGLTGFDDRHLLAGVAGVTNPLAFFTRNAIDFQGGLFYYRPLLLVSFWLASLPGPHGVYGQHLANILIHCAACLCLWRLLVELGHTPARSLAV